MERLYLTKSICGVSLNPTVTKIVLSRLTQPNKVMLLTTLKKLTFFEGYFQSVFSALAKTALPETNSCIFEAMPYVLVSYEGILNLLSKLKEKSASVPLCIPT